MKRLISCILCVAMLLSSFHGVLAEDKNTVSKKEWSVITSRVSNSEENKEAIDEDANSFLEFKNASYGEYIMLDLGKKIDINEVMIEYRSIGDFKLFAADTPIEVEMDFLLSNGSEEVSYSKKDDKGKISMQIKPQRTRYIYIVFCGEKPADVIINEINISEYDSVIASEYIKISSNRHYKDASAQYAIDKKDTAFIIDDVKRGDYIDIAFTTLFTVDRIDFLMKEYMPVNNFNVYIAEKPFEALPETMLNTLKVDATYEGEKSDITDETRLVSVYTNHPKNAKYIRIIFNQDINEWINIEEIYVHENVPKADYVRRTNWFAREDVYGVDGPSIPISSVSNGGISKDRSWDEVVNDVDIEKFADEIEAMGADYVMTSLGWGYFGIPMEPYERALGVERGVYTSHRDTLRELIDALKKRNIKVMVYWTGDVGYQCPEPLASSRFKQEYFDVWLECGKWVSDRYGKDICAWWVDGCHPAEIDARLDKFTEALRSGNPEAPVCYNAGMGTIDSNVFRDTADYTAGEGYGFSLYGSAFINGMRHHKYLPIGPQYADHASVFSNKKLIEHYKNLRAQGTCISWGVGSTGLWNGYTSTIQLKQLALLKEAIKEGKEIDFHEPLSRPYENIEAEDCTDFKAATTDNNWLNMTGGLLQSYDLEGNFDAEGIFYQSRQANTYITFDDVELDKGAIEFQANVRNANKRRLSQFGDFTAQESLKMEVRIGGITGEVIATIDNVNELDNLKFIDSAQTAPIRKGIYDFETVKVPVDMTPGTYDICITFTGYNQNPNLIESYITTAIIEEMAVFDLAKEYNEKWMYNKAREYLKNFTEDSERAEYENMLADVKRKIDENASPLNAFDKIYVKNYDETSGDTTASKETVLSLVYEPGATAEGLYLIRLYEDSWIKFNDVDFGTGADEFIANIVVGPGFGDGEIEVYCDSISSDNHIGTLKVKESDNWSVMQEQSVNIKETSGMHDVYLKFKPRDTSVGNLEYVRFSKKNAEDDKAVLNVILEQNGMKISNLRAGELALKLEAGVNKKYFCALFNTEGAITDILYIDTKTGDFLGTFINADANSAQMKIYEMDEKGIREIKRFSK